MLKRVAIWTLVSVLTTGIGPHLAALRDTGTNLRRGGTGCVYGTWSDASPVPLPGPQPSIAAAPSVARVGDETYLAGNWRPRAGLGVEQTGDLLVLATLKGHRISGPVGRNLSAFPRIVAGAGDTLHMVWAEDAVTGWDTARTAEPSPPSRPEVWPSWYRTLWHSAYADGVWSRPERIYTGGMIRWGDHGNSELVAEGGTVRVAVLASRDQHEPTVTLLTRTKGSWEARELRELKGVYPMLASLGGGRIILVYQGMGARSRDDSAPADTAHAMLMVRSADGGRNWSAPSFVAPTGPEIIVPLLLATRREIHLLWKEDTTAGHSPSWIHHYVARADGSDWRRAAAPASQNEIWGLQGLVDRCDAVHVFYEDRSRTETGSLIYTRWSGDRWLDPQPLFAPLAVHSAALTLSHRGDLRLVALGLRFSEGRAGTRAITASLQIVPDRQPQRQVRR